MAVVETNGFEVGEATTERPAVIVRTEIRGTRVSACWDRGTLTGDDELVRRVMNLAIWRRIDPADLSPAQLINLAREACAAPIETELLLSGGDGRTEREARPPRTT